MNNPTTPEAVKALQNALKSDKEYRDTWVANIACCIMGQFKEWNGVDGVHKLANDSANRFIDHFLSQNNSNE